MSDSDSTSDRIFTCSADFDGNCKAYNVTARTERIAAIRFMKICVEYPAIKQYLRNNPRTDVNVKDERGIGCTLTVRAEWLVQFEVIG